MSGSRWQKIRDNIATAIPLLDNYDGCPVYKLGIPNDIFHAQSRTAIGVCLAEDEWQSIDLDLQSHIDQPATMNIPIVVYCTSEASAEGVFEEDGQIDDICAWLLGTSAGPWASGGIRSVDIGIPGETGGVYLRAVRTSVIPDQKRAEGSGGALVKVIHMRTTALPL